MTEGIKPGGEFDGLECLDRTGGVFGMNLFDSESCELKVRLRTRGGC